MTYRAREPMDNFHYLELIRATAARVFLPEETVRVVFETLLAVMRDALLDRKRIIIREFGTLRVMIRKNSRLGVFPAVVFRASEALQVALRKGLIDVRGEERRGHDQVRGRDGGQGEDGG